MTSIFRLTHSTYKGYDLLISRITYISMIGYSNKLKEYYFDIGYESKEFSKFTLSFSIEAEALSKREEILEKLNKYHS